MEIIQPIIGAIDAWMAIYTNLPFAIRALCGLSVSLFLASRLVVLVIKQ